ncbi:MAG: hypothetical protein A3K19_08970 [Lentisphaerae bacterium RIFOXYB12_FULL_65_16]|nr:MAG: hypothetical protein A3K18_13655 [Lentisphaerae bacterium RIFOXYA12_64_32]OGV87679.1 MAG: hypothetical protein A3K19_08970 [Lentisphaerae bacterium RIFOXYB12_FULL_65_16]
MCDQSPFSRASIRRLFSIVGVALPLAVASAARGIPAELLLAGGATGGLVVHVGSGNGEATTGLHMNAPFIVLGLDTDAGQVREAREHAAREGKSGTVSFLQFDGQHLPLVDAVVNLLILSADPGPSAAEIARVLAPRGLVVAEQPIPAPRHEALRAVEAVPPGWSAAAKLVPAGTDEWTHYLHGPDGHVMSADTMVGPPYHIRWAATPEHARSHVHLTSVNVMVTACGRLFSIEDVAPTALPEDLPSRWAVVARDAFNGIELWRRPLANWQPYYVKDRNSYPADLHRRLVAGADRVFATLDIHGPVSALDAATGETLTTYERTEQTEDIVHENNLLFLSVNTGEKAKLNRREMAYRHVEPTGKRLMVFDVKDGRLLWEKQDSDTDGLMPTSLAVKGPRLFFQNPEGVVCLDKATGRLLWKSARPSEYFRPGWSSPGLAAFPDVVISADRQSGPSQKLGKDVFAAGGFSTGDLVAFAAETGERLWTAPCAEGCREPTDVFSVEGKLWFGKTLERKTHEYRETHDLLTGKVLSETPAAENWPNVHHHRCYRDKATVNFILAGRTGTEFIDLKTGEVKLHTWLRGSCKFGVMPANGLLYIPPDQCGCYIESKLIGFHALAPRNRDREIRPDTHPLQKGDAFGQTTDTSSETAEDWPAFRHDNARTGRTDTPVAPSPKQRWQVELGGKLTQPVVAHGRAFVAAVDANTLHALDAATGARQWHFVAGGRIDSPPTIANGLAVFGCADGMVYALRCSDGALAWRFRAAPDEHMLVAGGRVESVWPVHSSLLVDDQTVVYVAGRSSYLDGGVRMGTLDLATGKSLLERVFYSRDPKTGDAIRLYEPFPAGKQLATMEMPGIQPDVLSSDGQNVWMRGVTFNRDLEIQPSFPPHLFSSAGFLDDSWWELAYWMYGQHMFSGRAGVAHAVTLYPTARIMVCADNDIYGYQCGYEGIRTPALIASPKTPVIEKIQQKTKSGPRTISRLAHRWSKAVPVQAQGLVLARGTLFLAGPPEIDRAATRELLKTVTTDAYEPPPVLAEATATFLGRNGGLLCAVDAADGSLKSQSTLPAIPVFDGLIAANKRLYVSGIDGVLYCLE